MFWIIVELYILSNICYYIFSNLSDKSELDGIGPKCNNCGSTSSTVSEMRDTGRLCQACHNVCIGLVMEIINIVFLLQAYEVIARYTHSEGVQTTICAKIEYTRIRSQCCGSLIGVTFY